VIHQPFTPAPAVVRGFAASAAAALCGLVFFAGCRQGPDLARAKQGVGGALSPNSVQQYAAERGINNQQAGYELQQKVSQHDEEQAVENIDAVGVKQR
jgi:hypothetical protein